MAGIKFTSEIEYATPKRIQSFSVPGSGKSVSLRKQNQSHSLDARNGVRENEQRTITPLAQNNARDFWVFVAEDDPDDRMLIKEAFEESGHDVRIRFFDNGKDLVDFLTSDTEFLRRPSPGIILLDLNMPIMDGRATLKQLKAQPDTRKIPVIVLTTSNAEDDIESTIECGVSLYLTKPSTFDGLKEIVESLKIYWSGNARIPV